MVCADDLVIREEDTFTLPKQPLERFGDLRWSLENQLSAMANTVDLGKARVKREVEKEPGVLSNKRPHCLVDVNSTTTTRLPSRLKKKRYSRERRSRGFFGSEGKWAPICTSSATFRLIQTTLGCNCGPSTTGTRFDCSPKRASARPERSATLLPRPLVPRDFGSLQKGQSRLKKAFRALLELSLLETSTSLGVRRKSRSTIGCISPSSA